MIKLKESALDNYSKAYTRKIVAEFFSTHEVINGKQILSFSEISQVNMFVLQHLFANWREETARLQSPYFDYQAEEVKEALKEFMNTVSKFISVRREHFEPLVHYAVKSTLQLLLAPQEFIAQLISSHSAIITAAQLKEIGKYIQINKALFSTLVYKLESSDTELSTDQTLEMWNTIFEAKKDEVEYAEYYLEVFGKKVPIYKEDFFEKDSTIEEQPITPILNNLQVDIDQFAKKVDNKAPEELTRTQPMITIPVEQPKVISEQLKAASLHEKFMKEQATLNDRLKQETRSNTLLDKHQKTKIKDIKSAISLNQRFLFTNALFKGDNTRFNQALQELDQCTDYQSANNLLIDKYATQYQWNLQSEEVQTFFEVVQRKFY